ncbi:hypothetical protein MKW98_019466 [Papaver atlanticum]|uniref:Uncharacterized protein n=1 Tax=Papaver atlanticum TaxID=357466 RepID=A0AAD4S8D6_9MAGN|nr:hypothetical protein MKW98_019466 [Papaver atlanticum]
MSCSTEALKRKGSDSSSSSSTVRVRMSPGHYPFLRLTHEYRNLRDDLFTAMPQNPHYKPLEKFSAGVCENIKVGLDAVFINLALKMVKLSSPIELSSSDVQEEFIATLTQLEEMGYDCAKLWVKFDTLRAISAEGEGVSLRLEETTSKRRNKQVEATMTRTRIYELEAELKKLKAVLETEEEEIENLKFTERSPIEEREQILKNFRSAATAPW